MKMAGTHEAGREAISPRKEEIYRQASKLFFKKGYHGTGMRELAKAVGVEQAVLYYYYSSKADILHDIVKTGTMALMQSEEEALQKAESTAEKLQVFLTAHMTHCLTRREEAGMGFVEYQSLKPEQQAELREWQVSYLERFRLLLEQGIEEGVFRPVDTKAVTMMLLAGTTSMALWYDPKGRLNPQEMAAVFADTMAKGLMS